MQKEFRLLLEDGDVAGLRRAWRDLYPGMPQPRDDAEAEIALHYARTLARSVSLRKRAYSHRWLTERGLPTGLPDVLRPAAERMYPAVMTGVGIAALSPKPYTPLVQSAMREAVLEAYADHREDPDFVARRVREAREREMRKLGV